MVLAVSAGRGRDVNPTWEQGRGLCELVPVGKLGGLESDAPGCPCGPQILPLHSVTHLGSPSLPRGATFSSCNDCPRALAHAVSSPRILFLNLVPLLVLDFQVSAGLARWPKKLMLLDRQLVKPAPGTD